MSVFIPGMEMPKNCGACPICLDDSRICNGYCMYYHRRVNMAERDPKCPLVPLPEKHGRLGDLDALAKKCDEPHWCVWLNEIDDAPTIIEAEGGGEE